MNALQAHLQKARDARDPDKLRKIARLNGAKGGRPIDPNSARQKKLKKS